MAQARVSPGECPDKYGLMEDVRLAMSEVIALGNREMQAVIEGEFAKAEAIRSELVEVRKWKDSLIDSYRHHVTSHGC